MCQLRKVSRMSIPSRHAGGEFLDPGQVRADDGLGLVADMAVKALDPVVLGRPGAHAERIPALPPPLLSAADGLGRSSQVRQTTACPGRRLTMEDVPQPAPRPGRCPVAQWRAVGVLARLVILFRLGVGVSAGGLGDGQGEIVAGGLLGRHDQRVQIGRQPAIDQGKVANVTEIDRQHLRSNLLRRSWDASLSDSPAPRAPAP